MQYGIIYNSGDDCDSTKNKKHHYEYMSDGSLWCRMCGKYIDDKNIVYKIIMGCQYDNHVDKKAGRDQARKKNTCAPGKDSGKIGIQSEPYR